MNEIKRQLEKSIGDVTARSNRVIQKFEATKKMKRPTKKLSNSIPIFIAFTTFATVLAIFFLVGPWTKNEPVTTKPDPNPDQTLVTTPEVTPDAPEPNIQDNTSYKDQLIMFFKTEKSRADFYGIGNEYANFSEETTWLDENYVQIIIDNGGSQTRNIYRITDTAIEQIVNEYYEEETAPPTIDKLKQMPVISTILQAPFENGKVFDNKTMYTNVEVETFMGTYPAAIMVEDHENNVKRYYYEGLGFIGEKYELEDNYVVESYIAAINGNYTKDLNPLVKIYNETTRNEETYYVKDFETVDPFAYKLRPEQYKITYRKLNNVKKGEIGVFMHSCIENATCIFEFVYKTNSTFTTLQSLIYISYGNITYSPNNRYMVIPTYGSETKHYSSNETTIETGGLYVIDLNTIQSNSKESANYYGYYYPIISYSWVNEQTIRLEVPDIPNDVHETVYNWQNSERKTKTVDLKIQ